MKGILFKPDMITAIIDGRKTVTRRLGGLKEINQEPDMWRTAGTEDGMFCFDRITPDEWYLPIKPHYQIGEVVYIKEAWCEDWLGSTIFYKLDGGESPGPKVYFGKDGKWHDYKHPFWRSPMFLKAVNARYFIKITGVRPERLQEITYDDCWAEGIDIHLPKEHRLNEKVVEQVTPKTYYKELWDSINPKYPWLSNPWVWVYSFSRVNKGG